MNDEPEVGGGMPVLILVAVLAVCGAGYLAYPTVRAWLYPSHGGTGSTFIVTGESKEIVSIHGGPTGRWITYRDGHTEFDATVHEGKWTITGGVGGASSTINIGGPGGTFTITSGHRKPPR